MINKTKRSYSRVQNYEVSKFTERKYAGTHLLVDFWYGKNIEDEKELKEVLIKAAEKASSTVLKVNTYKFKPQGITGVVLLSESHIAIHTWPEIKYIAIDIFTCGEKSMPKKALKYFEKKFLPKKITVKEIKRGLK